MIGVAAAAAFLAVASPGELVEQPSEGSQAATEHNEGAGDELRRAAPVATTGLEASLANDSADNQAAEERHYAAEDLEAQQQMAFWTRVMGFSGLVALLLSVIGVWLIKRTFDETRRAAEAANATVRSFKDAERGDLSVEVRYGQANSSSDIVQYALAASNSGRSRVKVTGIAAAPLKEPVGTDQLEIRNFVETWVESGERWETHQGFDGPMDTAAFPYMGGYVRYRDRFGDEHRSYFCVRSKKSEPTATSGLFVRGMISHYTEDCLRERDWPRDY